MSFLLSHVSAFSTVLGNVPRLRENLFLLIFPWRSCYVVQFTIAQTQNKLKEWQNSNRNMQSFQPFNLIRKSLNQLKCFTSSVVYRMTDFDFDSSQLQTVNKSNKNAFRWIIHSTCEHPRSEVNNPNVLLYPQSATFIHSCKSPFDSIAFESVLKWHSALASKSI